MEEKKGMSEIEKRKEKIIHFFKTKTNLIVYGLLSIILFISAYIRTRPIPKLKDITTGTWTLGPDLDPFLFLRWAKYIAENGKLFLMDSMRYVPLANICSGDACIPVNTAGEMNLLSYMIAWLSKFLGVFSKEATVTYAAIIFPVIMAVLTGIAFFLFTRKLFYKENKKVANIIALISTAIFVLVPSLLPRTIAGIPEKESAAFLFIFLGLYFFLEAFTSEKLKRGIIFGVLAGVSTGLLGLIWGGVDFLWLGIAGGVLIAFLFGQITKNRFYVFGIWWLSFIITAMPFSIRYSLGNLLSSSSTLLVFMILFILAVDFLLFKKKIFKIDEKVKKKIKLPEPIISFLIAIIIGIVLSFVFAGGSVVHIAEDLISSTINPINQGRFEVTVAENKQPYFTNEWVSEFGPRVLQIPVYFWLFFVGSVFLFANMIKHFTKKEKIILTVSYLIFLSGLIFSKYAPAPSLLDGEGPLSLIIYFGGALIFIAALSYVYYNRHKEGSLSILNEVNSSYVFYFTILTIMTIAARGAVRLIMVLGAISPIVIGFLVVKMAQKYLQTKEDTKKLFFGVIAIVLIISTAFTMWAYYQSDVNMANNYVPGMYQQQWQKAMEWVRDNTPLDSVFAHWWDYGYWVQSIGERATILDGGNAVGYWNHFMGRHVLTGEDEKTALDFLYAHNGTHLLIDSTEIGKYSAYSSIGSDGNYDRFSWIPTIFMDESQTKETNNETMHIYPIGTVLDEDIILEQDGKEILLPKQKAVVAAIMVRKKSDGKLLQPEIFFVYNGKQYSRPLRYLYSKEKMDDFGSGIEAGIFIYPLLNIQNGGIGLKEEGAAFYLSPRVVNSQLARLYLYGDSSNYFKLAHSESNFLVEDLKKQGVDLGDFIYYAPAGGFQGPIKIWDITYPSNVKLNSTYLETELPEEFDRTNSGEY